MPDRSPPRVRVVAADSGTLVATIDVAATPLTRMVGLLGRTHLAEGEGLLLDPCNGIHTWFMRFPIDVIFLSREGQVVALADELPPFRLASGSSRASLTIELPAGARRRAGISVGSRLRLEAA